uniref:C-type lectin domain family 4 member F n=2 Tax=Rousettus aegyptiacus TaxID=9407 RepID=A0A7J8FGG7_ROUAE|nr:C-type lectin domain family 4 member F [Rousettus aegyptiacus]
MNDDKVHFCTDNQRVSLYSPGLDSSAVAPIAPKAPRLVLVTLALVFVATVTSLMALCVVVLQRPRPASEAYAFSQGFPGDNTTEELPVEPDNPFHSGRVAELQEAIQMFKDHVENSRTWSVEIHLLTSRVDNVSSQIQMLSGHLKNTSADVQMVLNDHSKNVSREIQTLKQGMEGAAALNSKTQTLEDNLQKANAEIQRLKEDFEDTKKILTMKIQEEYSRLENLSASFASQEQLQKTKNQFLQLALQGWMVYRKNLYYFSDIKESWHMAEQFCVSHGAHLASVTSAEEQAYLVMFTSTSYHWIGLTDSGTEGTWRWVDGTPFDFAQSRGFWNRNQPDNWRHKDGQSEDCVHIQQKWNDMNCNSPYQWVCKKPIS